ncbi:hypothetical protein NL676_023173 [Syzygium grande]|nr:hypothetical protein NL676_023173 [Syzygium grande]
MVAVARGCDSSTGQSRALSFASLGKQVRCSLVLAVSRASWRSRLEGTSDATVEEQLRQWRNSCNHRGGSNSKRQRGIGRKKQRQQRRRWCDSEQQKQQLGIGARTVIAAVDQNSTNMDWWNC